MCKVSLIIPMYNAQGTIKRCIDSILAQTHQNMEIIIIDDGSTDASRAIAKAYTKEYPFINLWEINHQGVAAARNTGIAMATGDYLVFVDADDTISAVYVEQFLAAYEQYHCDIVLSAYQEIYGHNIKPIMPLKDFYQGNFWDKYVELHQVCLFMAAKMYKRSIIQTHQLRFDTSLHTAEDQAFNREYYKYVTSCCYIPLPLYNYYRHNQGLSSQISIKYFHNDLRELENFIIFCNEHHIKNSQQLIGMSLSFLLTKYFSLKLRDYKANQEKFKTVVDMMQKYYPKLEVDPFWRKYLFYNKRYIFTYLKLYRKTFSRRWRNHRKS